MAALNQSSGKSRDDCATICASVATATAAGSSRLQVQSNANKSYANFNKAPFYLKEYNDLFGNYDYDANSFSNTFERSSNDLFVIHINTRSLKKNIDKLIDYMSTFNKQPDMTALAETKL